MGVHPVQCLTMACNSGLQGMLPPEAQDHERVRAQLTWALNAMNNSRWRACPCSTRSCSRSRPWARATPMQALQVPPTSLFPVTGRALGQDLVEAGFATTAAEMQSHVKVQATREFLLIPLHKLQGYQKA